MPKKIHGFDWIYDNNPVQLKWALEYLSDRGINCNFPNHLAPLKLKEIGQNMESTDEGRKFLERMRTSWRKKKSIILDIRKSYSFRLLPTTKKELTLLAKNNKKNLTDFLEQLINNNSNDLTKLK